MYKLGTRRSQLAQAQSKWVIDKINRFFPDINVKLQGIDTRGDQIQNTPLSLVQGKEFFVAELDEALQSGSVDFNVHSLKDLSLERPPGLVCAAIPERENPRDIILFGPKIIEKIRSKKIIKIGTSSPRRLENIPCFLEKALPQIENLSLVFLEIRGNVNSRIDRLFEEDESNVKYLDAVVLAFAGVIRLARLPSFRASLKNLKWMVLPLRECPTAPGQGALAIECRADDLKLREILGRLHDSETALHVKRERNLLGQWGGGCHQKFGATSIRTSQLDPLFYIRGKKEDGDFVEELRWNAPPNPSRPIRPWDGSLLSNARIQINIDPKPSSSNTAVFIAHSRALPETWAKSLENSRVWTSGVSSWFRLAKLGVWVEGCAEALGFSELAPVLHEPVLGLPDLRDWKILTHEDAKNSWTEGTVIATYQIEKKDRDTSKNDLKHYTHFYWNSSSQFEILKEYLPTSAHHASGPGKTAEFLRQNQINSVVFPSHEEWKKWLK